MTPSLIPRDWLFQGAVSGVSAAIGYGVGVLLAWPVRHVARGRDLRHRIARRVPHRVRRYAGCTLLVAVPACLSTMLVVAASWQREIAALMSIAQPTTGGWLRAGPLLLVVAALLLAGARAGRWAARLVARGLRRWMRLPGLTAATLGAVLVGLLAFTLVRDVLWVRVLPVAEASFSEIDAGSYPGATPPRRAGRSGSPAALVGWDSLGKEGRAFVAATRPLSQLAAAGGRPARDPIRVYVGLESAPTPQARADLAVAELDRTRAFDRSVLAVVTTTGTGWVNARAADGLELMYAGDTAIVATQYSYLPSALSFLADRTRAEEAARLLLDAVRARIDRLPGPDRPRLLVYGESLGAHGSQAAFGPLDEVRARADGVLWVGPPNSSRLWSELVQRRDPGTREADPAYAGGLAVRFAGTPHDLAFPPAPWLPPRVLYLQHPSDPVVRWSPELIYRRPDWLVEPRGSDVSPAMSWYPVVTFWQLTADLANAQSVPDGHGHNYGELILDGWVAIAAPQGWTPADTARVRSVSTR